MQIGQRLTASAMSTFSRGMLVHVRCRMTSTPSLTTCSARSMVRSAEPPPADHVMDTAMGGAKEEEVSRRIRSKRLTKPCSVRGGKNSYV